MRSLILNIILLFVAGKYMYAQQAVINGTVKDNVQLTALYATSIVLFSSKDSAVVKTTVADDSGSFSIAGIAMGNYFCRFSHSGYQQLNYSNIFITSDSSKIDLGIIILKPSATSLQEITISSVKQSVQVTPQKKVFAAGNLLAATGGNASDLLQQIPAVQINGSGEITVRGSASIVVLIDGRPSLIGGGSIHQLLQSLPANSIDKIELITNGGAKYSAEGESAIINIILKKNYRKGINGTLSAGAGTRSNYNAAAGFTYQKSAFNSYCNYNFQHSNTFSTGYQHLTSLLAGSSVKYSHQVFPSVTINKVHTINAGIDYSVGNNTRVSLSSGYNSNAVNRTEALHIAQYGNDYTALQQSRHNNNIEGTTSSFNINTDLIKKFTKPKEELLISLGYATGKIDNDLFFNSDVYEKNGLPNTTAPELRRNFVNTKNYYYSIKADYTLPLDKKSIVEIGYWSQWRSDKRQLLADSFAHASNSYLPDNTLINFYSNRNQVHALYVSFSRQFGASEIQLGLRGELSNLNGTVNGFDSSGLAYALPVHWQLKRLYPSFTFTQKWNNKSRSHFSYARRVVSPSPRNLNPLYDASDPSNYERGNPALLPEDVHLFELGHNYTFSKGSISANLYYRHISDLIRRVQTPVVDGRTTTLTTNFPSSATAGLELLFNIKTFKKLETQLNLNSFHNNSSALPAYGIAASKGFSFTAGMTNTFTFNQNLRLQLTNSYASPFNIAQDRNRYVWAADAGLSYQLLKKTATLNFAARDIFKTRYRRFLRVSDMLLMDFERITYNDRFSLSFTYRLGESLVKLKKIEHTSEKQEN